MNLQGNSQDALHRQKSPDQTQNDTKDLPQPVNHVQKFILVRDKTKTSTSQINVYLLPNIIIIITLCQAWRYADLGLVIRYYI